jgi:hypothetical protein
MTDVLNFNRFKAIAILGLLIRALFNMDDVFYYLTQADFLILHRLWPLFPLQIISDKALPQFILSFYMVSLFLTLLNLRNNIFLLAFYISQLWYYSLMSSQGWVSHFEHIQFFLIVTLFIIELFGDQRRKDKLITIFFYYLIITYSFNGAGKIVSFIASGFDLTKVSNLLIFNLERLNRSADLLSSLGMLPAMATVLISAIEATGIICLWKKRILKHWLVLIIASHFLMIIGTRIYFESQLFILLAAYLSLHGSAIDCKLQPLLNSGVVNHDNDQDK